MVINLFNGDSPVILALRHYKEKGPYFIIKMRRSSGDIISCHRVNDLPANWPDPFIQEIKETADRFFVNRSRIVN